MLRRSFALLLVACNPTPPPGDADSMTATPSTSTDGISSSAAPTSSVTTNIPDPTSTATTSTPDTTTTGATTGETTGEPPNPTSWTTEDPEDTTEGFVCNWIGTSEWDDFCPLAAAPNASLTGTTPFGPIDFQFAYFGLYNCEHCPSALQSQIVFFATPDGPLLDEPDRLHAVNHFFTVELALAGQYGTFEYYPWDDEPDAILMYAEIDVPSVAETNPPLDPAAPPVLSGKLTITGPEWDVSGEFTATLCRHVDLIFSCA